jgi:hypothetical protein
VRKFSIVVTLLAAISVTASSSPTLIANCQFDGALDEGTWSEVLDQAGDEVFHGGGLNACGCHFNRQTGECHCHQSRGCGCACQSAACG